MFTLNKNHRQHIHKLHSMQTGRKLVGSPQGELHLL